MNSESQEDLGNGLLSSDPHRDDETGLGRAGDPSTLSLLMDSEGNRNSIVASPDVLEDMPELDFERYGNADRGTKFDNYPLINSNRVLHDKELSRRGGDLELRANPVKGPPPSNRHPTVKLSMMTEQCHKGTRHLTKFYDEDATFLNTTMEQIGHAFRRPETPLSDYEVVKIDVEVLGHKMSGKMTFKDFLWLEHLKAANKRRVNEIAKGEKEVEIKVTFATVPKAGAESQKSQASEKVLF